MTYRLVVVAAAVLVLAGCSTADDPAESTPTVLPEQTTSQPTPSPTETAVALTDDMLLEPDEMPAWNEAGTWETIEDTDVLRACALPSAESLGAVEVVTRTFAYVVELGEGETANPDEKPMLGINQLAAWEDEASATAAVETWTATLDECSQGRGPIITTEAGETWASSARDESSMNESWFDFTGIAAEGSTTSVVAFSLWGQDANWQGDPLEGALQTSLDRLP